MNIRHPLLLILTILSFHRTTAQVSPATLNSLHLTEYIQKNFPAAENIGWDYNSAKKYVVGFTQEGRHFETVFNKKGEWFSTQWEYTDTALTRPNFDISYLHPNYEIVNAWKITYKAIRFIYVDYAEREGTTGMYGATMTLRFLQ